MKKLYLFIVGCLICILGVIGLFAIRIYFIYIINDINKCDYLTQEECSNTCDCNYCISKSNNNNFVNIDKSFCKKIIGTTCDNGYIIGNSSHCLSYNLIVSIVILSSMIFIGFLILTSPFIIKLFTYLYYKCKSLIYTISNE